MMARKLGIQVKAFKFQLSMINYNNLHCTIRKSPFLWAEISQPTDKKAHSKFTQDCTTMRPYKT